MEIIGQLHVPTALPFGKEHGVHMEQEACWTAVPPVVLKRSKFSCIARNCNTSSPWTCSWPGHCVDLAIRLLEVVVNVTAAKFTMYEFVLQF